MAMRLSEAEWALMEVLWRGGKCSLGEVTAALAQDKGWSRNTVYTYLKRMEGKGLVAIDAGAPRPYAPAVSREACAQAARRDLLGRIYGGATGDLLAAFLKDATLSHEEAERLRAMLDEMEV